MSKDGREAEPFQYEGPGCWRRAIAEGACDLAFKAAMACLLWRCLNWIGWLPFDQAGALAFMALAVVGGAGLGVAEHSAHHNTEHDSQHHDDAAKE